MLFVPPCANALRVVKTRLSQAIPDVPSSHLSEALATAAGFKTNAALRASLWEPGKDPASCPAFEFHDAKFLQRLHQLGHDDVGDWPGFSRFATRQWVSSIYQSDRSLCARNLMTAAVVSGLEQRHFGLGPEENFWPGAEEGLPTKNGTLFHVWMPEGIPTIGWVESVGMGELTIRVACWPKGDRIRYAGGFESGEVTAVGWLERERGAWIMNDDRGGIDLSVRRGLQGRISGAVSPTIGFADRGTFFL